MKQYACLVINLRKSTLTFLLAINDQINGWKISGLEMELKEMFSDCFKHRAGFEGGQRHCRNGLRRDNMS